LAGSEKPETLAEGVITDEMCRLRSDLAVVTVEGGDTAAIDGALDAAQRKLDILTGRAPNLIAFTHLCSAANEEHADDAARLEEEQAALDAYRASVLDEVSATPELSPEVAPTVGLSR
jgi:predicted ThiF/HesA family dinucleotide-utilizing enzyme